MFLVLALDLDLLFHAVDLLLHGEGDGSFSFQGGSFCQNSGTLVAVVKHFC